jgi:DNA-binding transcriptional MerR regulator
MRISELATETGVPVATIKFYLREGLLAAGTPLGPTQADYGEWHVRRLRLIRALREVGDLPLAAIRRLLEVLDDPAVSVHALLGAAQTAVSPPALEVSQRELTAANRLVKTLGWRVQPDAARLSGLASVLSALDQFDVPAGADDLRPWIDAAMSVATVEVANVPAEATREEQAEFVAVRTMLFGRLLAELRLLAQESVSAERFGARRRPGRA